MVFRRLPQKSYDDPKSSVEWIYSMIGRETLVFYHCVGKVKRDSTESFMAKRYIILCFRDILQRHKCSCSTPGFQRWLCLRLITLSLFNTSTHFEFCLRIHLHSSSENCVPSPLQSPWSVLSFFCAPGMSSHASPIDICFWMDLAVCNFFKRYGNNRTHGNLGAEHALLI